MMIQRLYWISIFVFLSGLILGQDGYFQQKVDVNIECELDDVNHLLRGSIQMRYQNNSKDPLDKIFMHLWPNAYRDVNSAFAQQKIRTNNTDFYFSEEQEKGNISALDFKINGKSASWELTKEYNDVAVITLPTPIEPGEAAIIQTPFLLKIPKSFSRLGHVGQSYQMTQWFPKPAVYDQEGWHPMPYLDIGEFYSEFGDYEVTITLPANYIVAATGTLQEETEKIFLDQQVARTTEALKETIDENDHKFPESSKELKTISFKAENVHDFAWFADKRFYVMKSNVELENGDDIATWTFFTNHEGNLWRNAINYVDRSVKFYSDHVGAYPYPQATAVQSALSAGGGMEYPMITVIGLMGNPAALDNVITHEVGHNWFYGILAFNERDHVWLDEGINSYYDHRYMSDYYQNYSSIPLPPMLLGHSELSGEEYALLYKIRRGADQAPTTHSDHFNDEINYFLGGYEKPAQAFHHLEYYLGEEVFDPIMKTFFAKWKFKHPQPQDLREHFEAATDKNLDWFFDGLIGSNHPVDYSIGSLNKKKKKLSIKNKGAIASPIPVGIQYDDQESTIWLEGFEGKKIISLEDKNIKSVEIDPGRDVLEIQRNNNFWNGDQWFPKIEPIQLQLLSRLENPKESQLFLMPAMGWNDYDGYMLGLGLHNFGLLQKPLEYGVFPMYGFESGELTGLATIRKHWLINKKWAQQISLGINARKFGLDIDNFPNGINDYRKYIKLNPYLNIELNSKEGKPFTQHIRMDYIRNSVDYNIFSFDGELIKSTEHHEIYRLSYSSKSTHAIRPRQLTAFLEYQNFGVLDFIGTNESLKLSLTYEQSYQYRKNKFFDWRFFGESFLMTDLRASLAFNQPLFFGGTNIALIHQGNSDYAFDDFYFGRSENDGIWSQQISSRGGGFKVPITQRPSSYSRLGLSNDYALALNLSADLPIKLPKLLPIKVYSDIGYFYSREYSSSESLLFNAGFMLSYLNGAFEIYFPVASSQNIQDAFDDIGGSYLKKIGFRLDLKRLDPTKIRTTLF